MFLFSYAFQYSKISCINGYLKSKIRIIVTHHVDLLEKADQIIVLKNGRILQKGTFDELNEIGLNLSEFSNKHLDECDSYAPRLESNERDRLIKSDKPKLKNIQLEYQEKQLFGKFTWNTYVSYFKSLCGYFGIGLILSFFVLTKLLTTVTDYYVSEW